MISSMPTLTIALFSVAIIPSMTTLLLFALSLKFSSGGGISIHFVASEHYEIPPPLLIMQCCSKTQI